MVNGAMVAAVPLYRADPPGLQLMTLRALYPRACAAA